jgi:hypothetical protein
MSNPSEGEKNLKLILKKNHNLYKIGFGVGFGSMKGFWFQYFPSC